MIQQVMCKVPCTLNSCYHEVMKVTKMATSRITIIHEWKRDAKLADGFQSNREPSMYPTKHQHLDQHEAFNHRLIQ